MLRRDLQGLVEYAAAPRGFAASYLEKPKAAGLPRDFAEAALGIGIELIALQLQLEGPVLHTPAGAVHLKDLVAFRAADGSVAVGFAKKLLQHADGSHWCLLLALESLGGAAYNKANGRPCTDPGYSRSWHFSIFCGRGSLIYSGTH